MSDFGFKDIEGSDFDAFQSVATSTTAASTKFPESVEQSVESSEKKKKKKKKDKEKEKKSSSSRKSSKSSRRKSLTEDPTPSSGEISKQLLSKMICDAFGDDFGDFGDEDLFETVRFDEDDWGSASKESKSEGSNSISRTSSHAGMKTYSTGEGQVRSSVDSGGARTTQSKTKLVLDMDVHDMFAQQQNHQDLLNGDDEESIISELTGLTGVFQGVPQYDPDEEKEDDREDPDLPKIMKQLLQEQPPAVGRESTMINAPSSRRITKSCMAAHSRPPQRANSLVTTTSRSTTSSRSSTGTKRIVLKSLQFSTVSIRVYDRILTENPSTIQGPSIGIGWRFQQIPTMDLNAYELERGEPRPAPELVLTRTQREAILTAQGVSAAEIAAGVRSNNKARQQRRQTVQNLKAIKVEEAVEGAVKKIWNPFGGRSKK